jgi:dihydrofolate reductase
MASAPLTQYLVASSLDGFITDENDSLDWLNQFQAPQSEDAQPYDVFIKDVGALAMGRGTYEWIARDHQGPWPYGERPTWVFTHRELTPLSGADVTFTAEDVATVHAEMTAAAKGKNIWLVGGGDLVGQFLDHGLLDEIWLSIAPVTLGKGAPLLPRRHTTPLTLISAVPAPNQTFVHLRYRLEKETA